LFFEKKAPRLGEQKTFAKLATGVRTSTAQRTKSFFASFFSKKEALSLTITPPPTIPLP
jgi:hypothetical protein